MKRRLMYYLLITVFVSFACEQEKTEVDKVAVEKQIAAMVEKFCG